MKKIVITGPECSGKSHLAKQLAQKYSSPWVPEYARVFLERLPRPYVEEDLMAIAAGQESIMHEIKSKFSTAEWLFIDTWDMVLRVWQQYKFGRVNPLLLAFSERYEMDHYLLCAPDLPWAPDPLREHPEKRDELYEMYVALLEETNSPYTVISGSSEERLQKADRALQSLS